MPWTRFCDIAPPTVETLPENGGVTTVASLCGFSASTSVSHVQQASTTTVRSAFLRSTTEFMRFMSSTTAFSTLGTYPPV